MHSATCKGAESAVPPGFLVANVLAAKADVRARDERQVDAHEKVTDRQVAQVKRMLHIAARFVKITASQDEQIAHHRNRGHDPNAVKKQRQISI